MSTVAYTKDDLLRLAQGFAGTPRILSQLTQLIRDHRMGLADAAVLLRRDANLAARIIRIANSAAFSPSEPVASIEAASQLVGLQEIHRIVGVMAMDQIGPDILPAYGLTKKQLRMNSILVALLMEEFATAADEDPPTAYAIGLLRPLGLLAFDLMIAEAGSPERVDPAVNADLGAWESDAFGLTSSQATALILEAWHFPGEIPRAIRDHRNPTGKHLPFIHLLHIAARMADKLGYGLPCEAAIWTDSEETWRKAGLDPRDTQRHVDRAFIAFDRLCRAVA
jgi:HD-like signal output (HDOD) protein